MNLYVGRFCSYGFTVTTAKGKAYPMRVQSEVDREMWMQRIRLAMDADTLPNYSVSAPSATEAASKSAVLGGAAPAAGGGGLPP